MSNFEKTPKRVRMMPTCWTILMRELLIGGKSYDDLAEATGLSARTIRDWITPMRARCGVGKQNNLIHISGWRENGSGANVIPEFSWNPGAPNVRRVSEAISDTEKCRRYRAKKKAMALHGIMSSMVSVEVRA